MSISLARDTTGNAFQVTLDQKPVPRFSSHPSNGELQTLPGKLGEMRVFEDGMRSRYYLVGEQVHEVNIRGSAVPGMLDILHFEVWVDQKGCLRHFSLENATTTQCKVRRNGREFTEHQGVVNGWKRATVEDVKNAHEAHDRNRAANEIARRQMDPRKMIADAVGDATAATTAGIAQATAAGVVSALAESGLLKKSKGGSDG